MKERRERREPPDPRVCPDAVAHRGQGAPAWDGARKRRQPGQAAWRARCDGYLKMNVSALESCLKIERKHLTINARYLSRDKASRNPESAAYRKFKFTCVVTGHSDQCVT